MNDRTRRLPRRCGTLRTLGLGLLALVSLAAVGCANDEPYYLPLLPDLSSGPSATEGVPCEVAKLLADKCLGCHGQPPAASPMALVSYANLTIQSMVDPKQKVIARAILRMQDATNPMPPGPTPTVKPSELVPLQKWVAAGAPLTTCTTSAQAPHQPSTGLVPGRPL